MNEIPCPPDMYEQCPVFEGEGQCYTDNHHEYWPQNKYRDGVGKVFRALAVNQTVMCRFLHNEEHAGGPPPKPSREDMLNTINKNKG